MVLQEFVFQKEKSDKVAKDLSRLNEIKRKYEEGEKPINDKHGRSDTGKHSK